MIVSLGPHFFTSTGGAGGGGPIKVSDWEKALPLAKNIAKVTTTGVETDIQFSREFTPAQRLWATAGFVWLKSKSSDALPSFYISSHAKYLVNFNVQYVNRLLAFSINGLYKERQPQAAASPAIAKVSKHYYVLNAKAEAFLIRNLLTVYLEVDNLSDTDYTDLLGSQMPGRWLMGGIKITLSK